MDAIDQLFLEYAQVIHIKESKGGFDVIFGAFPTSENIAPLERLHSSGVFVYGSLTESQVQKGAPTKKYTLIKEGSIPVAKAIAALKEIWGDRCTVQYLQEPKEQPVDIQAQD